MSLAADKAHGLYSSKMRVPVAQDTFGKPVQFNATVAPYYEPPRATRDAYKGKQILTRAHLPPFSKLEYASEPYDDSLRKGKERKNGFGTSQPLNRDDLSSTLEVGRHRHHLEIEQKQARTHAAGGSPGSTTAGFATSPVVSEQQSAASARLAETAALREAHGLFSTLPKFDNEFDRTRHVSEFSTRKYSPSVKYERVLGSSRPVSHDIGEGAFDIALLKSPERGVKKPGTHSIVHPAVAVLNPGVV